MPSQILKFNGREFNFFVRDRADISVMREIFKLREYRVAEAAIRAAREPILDAGAHAGFFSVYCRALNPKVKIYALEPEADNVKLLKQHLEENKIKGVAVISGALAGESGERELVISKDSHSHRLISPSYQEGVGGVAEDMASAPQTTVRAFSLPDFCEQNKIKKISLLKMDIEGAEFEVLKNLTPEDFRLFKTVILEYHNRKGKNYQEIENRLRENGFGVRVFPSKFDKTLGFLFGVNKRK